MEESQKGKREGRRVALDDDALSKVNQFSRELKRGHCKVTHSQLVSMAVNIFFERYLSKEKPKFEKSFFDQRSYLKAMLNQSSSEEEITTSVKTFLKKVEGGGRAKKANRINEPVDKQQGE